MERNIRKTEFKKSKIKPLKRVAAYARVSTGKETMLQSLSAQVSYYSSLIQKHHDWVYMGVYADEAISGTKGEREQFARLLSDCREGKVDLIITKSISRFARNTLTLLSTIRELRNIGVDVYFESENIHSISHDGEFMLTVMAGIAEAESLSVSENCKWRIRKRFEDGELANLRFMFGYRIHKGKVEIDPEQAAIVRMIFDDYIRGDGCGKIAKTLQSMDVRGIRDAAWTPSRVARLLKNEKYTGNAVLMKRYRKDHLTKALVKNNGELPLYEATGTHDAIIDEATFQQAQALMALQRSPVDADETPKSIPFTGMIRCDKCGKNYKRIIARGKPAWNCSTYLVYGKSACHTKKIPEDILVALASQALGVTTFDAAAFGDQVKEIRIKAENKAAFCFRDGRELLLSWQNPHRGAGWSEESRQAARDRMIKMRRQRLCAPSHP